MTRTREENAADLASEESQKITAEMFEEATGHPPKDDDLDRCNCPKAGEMGHLCCGWSHEENLPVFMSVTATIERMRKIR